MAIRPLTSTLTVELNQILTHPDPIDHQNLTCDRNTESERGWETWYLMIFAVTQCVCVCVSHPDVKKNTVMKRGNQ